MFKKIAADWIISQDLHLRLLYTLGASNTSIYKEVREFRDRHPMSLESMIHYAKIGAISRDKDTSKITWHPEVVAKHYGLLD